MPCSVQLTQACVESCPDMAPMPMEARKANTNRTTAPFFFIFAAKMLRQVQNDIMQRESEIADLTDKIEELEKYRKEYEEAKA